MDTSDPVTTDEDGVAMIPIEQGDAPIDTREFTFNGYKEYAASAQTADGKLMIMDLSVAGFGGFFPGSSAHSEVMVDRTVVGMGARPWDLSCSAGLRCSTAFVVSP